MPSVELYSSFLELKSERTDRPLSAKEKERQHQAAQSLGLIKVKK